MGIVLTWIDALYLTWKNLLILYECQHFAVLGYFFRKSKILNGRHLSKLTEIASKQIFKILHFYPFLAS